MGKVAGDGICAGKVLFQIVLSGGAARVVIGLRRCLRVPNLDAGVRSQHL